MAEAQLRQGHIWTEEFLRDKAYRLANQCLPVVGLARFHEVENRLLALLMEYRRDSGPTLEGE